MQKNKSGFTIIELLIVIVVIAILAAITIVAYNGIQQRARDAQRQSDIKTIVKVLELYYTENGYYPNRNTYTPGSTLINSGWSTTADGSWTNLAQVLGAYAKNLPTRSTASSTAAGAAADSYDYFGFADSSYCGSSAGQGYILVYHLDSSQSNTLVGNCSGTPLGPYGSDSNYRVVK